MNKSYTEQEDKIIIEMLPTQGYEAALKMLPGRTYDGVASRAKVLRSMGKMHGFAISHSPFGKVKGENKPRNWQRMQRAKPGTTRMERYMAGESAS